MFSKNTAALDRDALRPLLEKRDRPGVVRMLVQLAWFGASVAATLALAGAGSIWQWPAVISAGIALATFFPPMHEASHRTAFRTGWLNEATLWWGAFAMLEPPTFFREFHWEHHRKTQDVDHDPEIAAYPKLLDPYPSNPIVYLALVSGQLLLIGKLMFTVAFARSSRPPLHGGESSRSCARSIGDALPGRRASSWPRSPSVCGRA